MGLHFFLNLLWKHFSVSLNLFYNCFQIETGSNPGILFKTHPNINKELFSNENILGLKDPNRPFPTGQGGDAAGVGLLKWRMQSVDESDVPLTSGFQSYAIYHFGLFCVVIIYIIWFVLQLTAGHLFLEMKLMSALNTKLHQCLICEMLWSRFLFQLFVRHLMWGKLMGNGGGEFQFILIYIDFILWKFNVLFYKSTSGFRSYWVLVEVWILLVGYVGATAMLTWYIVVICRKQDGRVTVGLQFYPRELGPS